VQQRRKGSLRWGWVAAWFVLVAAVTAGVHWVLDQDAPWTDHLIVGALWGVSNLVLIGVLQRRRDSQG
jgi:membrane protein YdbS with pleckstrin-like domain